MCLKWFRKKEEIKLDPPEFIETVDGAWLFDALNNEFGQLDFTFYQLDTKYKTCTLYDMLRFLDYDYISENIYVSEFLDCDDFAVALFGAASSMIGWSSLPIGLMFVDTGNGYHAVNVFIDSSGIMYVIEPQNDKIFSMPENWSAYFLMI